MKEKYLTILAIISVALAAQVIAPPKRDKSIQVVSSKDLNASRLQVIVDEFYMDRTMKLNVGFFNDADVLIDRRFVVLGTNEVKLWINSETPDATLETLILSNVGLVKK